MSNSRQVSKIVDAKLISLTNEDQGSQIDITLDGSTITSISPHQETATEDFDRPDIVDARGCLVGPSLCHAHIHLDKCFLLGDPKYSDLEIVEGDFAEALRLTSQAKQRFENEDLLRRGRWLIEESIAAGVTMMRVFVEIDVHVEFKCLNAATALKHEYADRCHLQICAFAQDPIFSTSSGDQNRSLLTMALLDSAVDVVGTTPYVEDNEAAMLSNISWGLSIALEHDKHLDFHLDYNISPTTNSCLPALIDLATPTRWNRSHPSKTSKAIALAHCTRLTLFNSDELKSILEKANTFLPISLIGLPTSDLYMMGRPEINAENHQNRPRGTLQIPTLLKSIPSLHGAIAINNVGNVFTPQGNCDPLSIASLGVGLYHAGSKQDTEILYQCVSSRAKEAIGEADERGNEGIVEGGVAELVIFGKPIVGSKGNGRRVGSVHEIVYDPPRVRRTIFKGRLVAG